MGCYGNNISLFITGRRQAMRFGHEKKPGFALRGVARDGKSRLSGRHRCIGGAVLSISENYVSFFGARTKAARLHVACKARVSAQGFVDRAITHLWEHSQKY
jgi:hypothetical protein